MAGVMSALQKFFTKDRMMILVIFIVFAVFLMYYSSGKSTIMDSMEVGTSAESAATGAAVTPETAASTATTSAGYTAQDVANPSELLPKDDNSQWASLNPSSQNSPNTPDLLQAGYHIGLDTVGQTLKNPNMQLRSDPIISKGDVGPWNQSTVEPDLMRVPLEVGTK
jgi:hypothetical protein